LFNLLFFLSPQFVTLVTPVCHPCHPNVVTPVCHPCHPNVVTPIRSSLYALNSTVSGYYTLFDIPFGLEYSVRMAMHDVLLNTCMYLFGSRKKKKNLSALLKIICQPPLRLLTWTLQSLTMDQIQAVLSVDAGESAVTVATTLADHIKLVVVRTRPAVVNCFTMHDGSGEVDTHITTPCQHWREVAAPLKTLLGDTLG